MDALTRGGFYRPHNATGVKDALRDFSNQYGPSQSAYQTWKKSGIPTSNVLQTSTFGTATKKIV